MTQEEIKQILPHRGNMLLLDEVYQEDEYAHGKFLIRDDAWFLDGHFPGNPAVLSLALYGVRNRGRAVSFLGGMLIGSAVEYVCSWLQELVLGTRSWDYSHMPFNLNGRICLLYSTFWGILGVLWIKDIYPRMSQWILHLPNTAGKILTWALVAFLAFDGLISALAVARWSARAGGDVADSAWEVFMDERFPDERMERIYANMSFVE